MKKDKTKKESSKNKGTLAEMNTDKSRREKQSKTKSSGKQGKLGEMNNDNESSNGSKK